MSDTLQAIYAELAELKTKMANMLRYATVNEVQRGGGERKIRMNMGEQSDGSPDLGPWQHYSGFRGMYSEDTPPEPGQTMLMLSADGNPRNCVLLPGPENDKHYEPPHATDKGHSYAYGGLREYREGKPPGATDPKGSAGGSGSGSTSTASNTQQQEQHNTLYELWFADESSSGGGGTVAAAPGSAGTGNTSSERGAGRPKDPEEGLMVFRFGVRTGSKTTAGEGGSTGGGDNTKPAALLRVGKGLKSREKENEIIMEAKTKITFKVGDSTIVIESDKVTIKSTEIITDGINRLGDPNADKLVSGKGTLDTAQHADEGPVAKNVYVKFGS